MRAFRVSRKANSPGNGQAQGCSAPLAPPAPPVPSTPATSPARRLRLAPARSIAHTRGMSPAPVRTVVLGNSFAAKVQLPALAHAESLGGVAAEVVGIAGADGDKARATAREFGIPQATADWRELLALEPELVIVSTPVHLHAPMVLAALETDAAILCEKPFALDTGEGRVMCERAEGRLALLDHQMRWSPARRKLHDLVLDGFLGEPWHARAAMLHGNPARIAAPWSWWYDAQRGGGALGALGSHAIDGIVHDLGGVESVRARLSTLVHQRADGEGRMRPVTADEHAALWLSLESGCEVQVEVGVMAPHARMSTLEYVGSEGTLRLEDELRLIAARHDGEPYAVEVDSAHVPTPAVDHGPFALVLPLYLADVVAAVRAGASELEGAARFEDGLATLRVMEAARQSSRDATWVPCNA